MRSSRPPRGVSADRWERLLELDRAMRRNAREQDAFYARFGRSIGALKKRAPIQTWAESHPEPLRDSKRDALRVAKHAHDLVAAAFGGRKPRLDRGQPRLKRGEEAPHVDPARLSSTLDHGRVSGGRRGGRGASNATACAGRRASAAKKIVARRAP